MRKIPALKNAVAGCVLALVAALAGSAIAAGSSIRLAGPHVNRFGSAFHYVASGVTTGPANHVWAWETPALRSCAPTYKEEISRGRIFLFVSRPLARNRRFSFVIRFVARNREAHRLCAYIVNQGSGRTFARAEASWRNE